jgi:gliding motility-associated-like protein
MVAETVTITGQLDGTAIMDDATITFTPDSSNPDLTNVNTTISATGPVVADGMAESIVTVQLSDANDNLLRASGGTVTLSSTGSAIVSAVTDNNDGSYTATVTNMVAETVTITGQLDGNAISDNASIVFIPGVASPDNVNTTIVADNSAIADGVNTASVIVQLADANGNNLTSSGGTVTLTGTGSAVISAVTDNNNGSYTATVTNTIVEIVTITGQIEGVDITDNASISFVSGPINASNTGTLISGVNTTLDDDGFAEATISVNLKDVSGNDLQIPGVSVSFVSTGNAVLSESTIVTDITGRAVVTVTNTTAEEVNITATVDHDEDPNTPEIAVTNGSPLVVTFVPKDSDGDGVPDVNEDTDGDGDPNNDDTDGDGIPDFQDEDDDGDGIPSREEDINRDGNFFNDDTDGDGKPNFLDSIDGAVPTKTFSPNGDGINDVLHIEGIEDFPNNEVQLFNRNGSLVYKVRGYNNRDKAWNGFATQGILTSSSEGVPAGTYFYVINLNNGQKRVTGFIVIKR